MENTSNYKPVTILSLMSGTSADGIDAVLATFELIGGKLRWQVVARLSRSYSPELRERILQCLKPERSSVLLITEVHREIGNAYADLVKEMQTEHTFDTVALSGQTVYHIPRVDEAMNWQTPSTLQLGEAAVVAEACGLPVVSDFRQSDMAAGGQGAPMVSFGDYLMFSEAGKARAVHNLGGISNLTYLPADGDPDKVFAFDTGPANCLIDEAVKKYCGLEYDEGGRIAALGKVHRPTLDALMQHPYLHLALPKTTGRETFTLDALDNYLNADLEASDLVATLTAFTAHSVAHAYERHVREVDDVLVAGGGALNETLMAMLRDQLDAPITTFEDLGYRSRDREALAFGVMAYHRLHGLPNTLPGATGAKHAVVAGKISVPSSAQSR